jgi:hypothetical protein
VYLLLVWREHISYPASAETCASQEPALHTDLRFTPVREMAGKRAKGVRLDYYKLCCDMLSGAVV